jgi:hypothetical protein
MEFWFFEKFSHLREDLNFKNNKNWKESLRNLQKLKNSLKW